MGQDELLNNNDASNDNGSNGDASDADAPAEAVAEAASPAAELLEKLAATTWESWLIFLAIAVIAFICLRIAVGMFLTKVQTKQAELEKLIEPNEPDSGSKEQHQRNLNLKWLIIVLKRTTVVGYLGSVIIIAANLTPDLAERAQIAFVRIGIGLLVLQVGIWGTTFLDTGLMRIMRFFHISEEGAQTAIGVLRFFGFLVLWSMVAMLVLVNLNVQIAPLIAGLGVGGIAIAFALQRILADIFSSVAIVLDRPFEVGDFIIIGNELGAVERIGIKTTRIRSLSGEQIVMANEDLLTSRIRNFKKMQERRVVFRFGVLYQTPPEELEKIGGYVREIIKNTENTRFDRAHFMEFGDSSYNFEVVYYVLSRDFAVYMDAQQKINVAIVRKLAEIDVEIAYPTRTLFLSGESRHRVSIAEAPSKNEQESN